MALPDDVITRNVTFGSSFQLETGADLSMAVAIKASRIMVWEGNPAVPISSSFTSDPVDGAQSVPLPVTDQAGWKDTAGSTISVASGNQTHTYTATIEYRANGVKVAGFTVGPFALPQGDLSDVDLDQMIPAGVVEGITVSIPDEWTDQIDAIQAEVDAASFIVVVPVGDPDPTGLDDGTVIVEYTP